MREPLSSLALSACTLPLMSSTISLASSSLDAVFSRV